MTETFETIRYTADVVAVTPDGDVLLIERGWEPHKGAHALPGGHVDRGETSLQAAVRELAEETGVHVKPADLTQVGTFDRPDRDPRGRYVTIAYLAVVPGGTPIIAGDDARTARWWPLDALPKQLAFDHDEILSVAVGATSCDTTTNGRPPTLLSPEREAEIRQRVKVTTICPKAQSNGRLDDQHTWSGGSFTHTRCELCGHTRTRGDQAEETAEVLAELDRTRAESEKRRVRMAAAEADLMNIRGALSPNGFPRRVPMELGDTIAPVIEWLLDERDELKKRVSELGQPTIEARRNAIRGSYFELAAQAREDQDYEGEQATMRRLERREAEWAAEDTKASKPCPDAVAAAEKKRLAADQS